nr:hypothetical protein TCMXXGQR_TCMXXGQR_CDS_0004 [Microvirus sp.]
MTFFFFLIQFSYKAVTSCFCIVSLKRGDV